VSYTFREMEFGPIRIFKLPEEGMVYTMGTDASTGLAEDYSCSQIVANAMPFEQVAVFRGKLPVNTVTEYVNALGRFYNEALNICEINYPGNSVQDALLQYYHYPRNYQAEQHLDDDPDISHKFGFRMTELSKWMLIHETQMLLQANEMLVSDPVTLSEMSNFVYQAKKKQAGGAPGFNDDCVIALMLALHGAKMFPICRPKAVRKKEGKVDPDTRRDWRVFREKLMTTGAKSKGVVI